MYKLTKLSIREGHNSRVGAGESCKSDTIRVIRRVTPDDIKEDDEIYVARGINNFIKTSPVQRIEKNDTNWTIWTKTSVYNLDINKEK